MSEVLVAGVAIESVTSVTAPEARLSELRPAMKGTIVRVGADTDPDIERRLLELGFVEGADIEVLHEGLIGRDPIAVKIGNTRLALRRREASNVLVRRLGR